MKLFLENKLLGGLFFYYTSTVHKMVNDVIKYGTSVYFCTPASGQAASTRSLF